MWTRFTLRNPCPVCGRHDNKCSRNPEGLFFCRSGLGGTLAHNPSFHYISDDRPGVFGMYVMDGASDGWARYERRPKSKPASKKPASRRPFSQKRNIAETREPLSASARKFLATQLGLPQSALDPIFFIPNDSYNRSCFGWEEQDGAGTVTGYGMRYPDGSKKAAGQRGILTPSDWRETALATGTVYCPEGMSDTLTLTAMNLAAVGRPSNMGGMPALARLFADLPADVDVIVLGENDQKDSGQWPGREGAVATAEKLSEALNRPVTIAFPPAGTKDVREWYKGQAPYGAAAAAHAFRCGLIISKVVGPRPAEPAVVPAAGESSTPEADTSSAWLDPAARLWCHDTSQFLQFRKDCRGARLVNYRCHSCPNCLLAKKRGHIWNLEDKMGEASADAPFCTFMVPSAGWDNDMHGRPFDGRFVRIRQSMNWLVIACGRPNLAVAVRSISRDEAIALARESITAHDGRGVIAKYGKWWGFRRVRTNEWEPGYILPAPVTGSQLRAVARNFNARVRPWVVPPKLRRHLQGGYLLFSNAKNGRFDVDDQVGIYGQLCDWAEGRPKQEDIAQEEQGERIEEQPCLDTPDEILTGDIWGIG